MTALPEEAPSAQLIEKATSGDPSALDSLVQRYYRTVFSIGYARLRDWELAEELAQEVFLRATLHLSSLRDRALFGPWLVRIARNTAEDWARQGASRARTVTWIPLDNLPAEPPDTRHPSVRDLRARRDEERLLAEALARLSPELREVVLLHFSEGLTKSAIARRLDLHPSSVARQLDRALLQLREDLGPRLERTVRAAAAPARGAARTSAALLALFTLSEATRQAAAAATAPAVGLAAAAGGRSAETQAAQSAPAAAGFLARLLALLGGGGGSAFKGATLAATAAATLAGGSFLAVRAFSPAPVDEERFPLAADVTLLKAPPPMPARRAPMVYLAATTPARPEDQPAADAFHSLLRFHLNGAPADSLPLNIVAYHYMHSIHRRTDGPARPGGLGRDQSLRDARSFDADFYLGTAVASGRETVSLELEFLDLRISRTAASTTVTTHREFPRLLEEAVRASARFCGLSDQEIAAAAMTDGLPSPATWDFLRLKDGEPGTAAWKKALAADPSCRSLYSLAAEKAESLSLINEGLARWPDDPRLFRSKADILRKRHRYEPAALFCSELNRRYPDSQNYTTLLLENLISLYPARPEPSSPPEAYQAGVEAMNNVARRYPSNFGTRWDTAYGCDSLGMLVRGCRRCATTETAPTEAQARLAQELGHRAREEVDAARAIRPDLPALLRAVIIFHSRSGHTDVRWQKAMLEELARLDPSDVEGAVAAAESHGIWGTSDGGFIELLEEAAARHRSRPKALARIAHVIGTELSDRMREGMMTPEAVYRDRNRLSDLYVDCTERALDGGVQVEKWMAGMLREIYRKRHGEGRVNELVESGKHWALTGGGAKAAHDGQDYERCLRLALLSLPKAPTPDAREQMRYYVVKSLWKLNRLDEALKEARAGISEFPERQTFHYMFARVALDRGGPLEEAYERAKRAVDISTTNTGANAVYESLRRRLGR